MYGELYEHCSRCGKLIGLQHPCDYRRINGEVVCNGCDPDYENPFFTKEGRLKDIW
jgi:hypothetical protein